MLEIVRGSFDKNAIVKRQLDEYFSTNVTGFKLKIKAEFYI